MFVRGYWSRNTTCGLNFWVSPFHLHWGVMLLLLLLLLFLGEDESGGERANPEYCTSVACGEGTEEQIYKNRLCIWAICLETVQKKSCFAFNDFGGTTFSGNVKNPVRTLCGPYIFFGKSNVFSQIGWIQVKFDLNFASSVHITWGHSTKTTRTTT